MEERISVAAIIARTFGLVAAQPLPALAGLVLLLAAGIAVDLQSAEVAGALTLPFSIAMIFAQFLITRAVLVGEGLRDSEGAGRAGSYVLVLIVTGLAIALGTLLLVLPGLYLYARWSIAAPLVIAEGATFGDALRESGERTTGSILPIMVALAAILIPWAAALAIYFLWLPTAQELLLPTILANLLNVGGTILAWYAAIAIYALTRRSAASLEEVFA